MAVRYKDFLSQVWNSNVKDKTVARPSYLKHGDPYIGKTTYLYWDGHSVFPASDFDLNQEGINQWNLLHMLRPHPKWSNIY